MVLQDTVNMMVSDDYKERFKAEYYQLLCRINGLNQMLIKWDNGALNFEPTCPREIYDDQIEFMGNYMAILLKRATIEGIEL